MLRRKFCCARLRAHRVAGSSPSSDAASVVPSSAVRALSHLWIQAHSKNRMHIVLCMLPHAQESQAASPCNAIGRESLLARWAERLSAPKKDIASDASQMTISPKSRRICMCSYQHAKGLARTGRQSSDCAARFAEARALDGQRTCKIERTVTMLHHGEWC